MESIELVDDAMNFDPHSIDIAQSIDIIGGNADLGAMAALLC